jgi:hypothetical protein
MAKAFTITSATFSSPRHTAHYWGPESLAKIGLTTLSFLNSRE